MTGNGETYKPLPKEYVISDVYVYPIGTWVNVDPQYIGAVARMSLSCGQPMKEGNGTGGMVAGHYKGLHLVVWPEGEGGFPVEAPGGKYAALWVPDRAIKASVRPIHVSTIRHMAGEYPQWQGSRSFALNLSSLGVRPTVTARKLDMSRQAIHQLMPTTWEIGEVTITRAKQMKAINWASDAIYTEE